MKIKTVGLAVATAMLLSMMAVPASASPAPNDVGVIQGTAEVGKKIDDCTKDFAGTPSGSGLGFPLLSTEKTGWFRLLSLNVISVAEAATGGLSICGKLNPTLTALPDVAPGLGASCGLSKGFDGVGKVEFPGSGTVIGLNDVGWKNSAGGFLPVTGQANDTTKKTGGHSDIVAPTFAFGGQACADKRDNAPEPLNTGEKPKDGEVGARSFTTVAVYAIVPHVIDRNDIPGHEKPGPLYDNKQEPKRG